MVGRHCEVVLQASSYTQENIETCIKEYKTIKEWAYILHDKDKNDKGATAPHYHIYLWFGVGVDFDQVASWFKTLPQNVEKVKTTKKAILKYLTHDNAPTKYQYPKTEVKSNFDLEAITDEKSPFSRFSDFDNYSYAQHIDYLKNEIDDKLKIKGHELLKKQWLLHTEYLETKGDRMMKVIFMEGVAGSGKTTFAKQLSTTLKKDYYVSSSSNDSLQGYKGQKVLILDDARDSTFPFNDLLKILDNNTSSSVRSRYQNKVFNGDIIIITSVVPLYKWYSGIDSKVSEESLAQLYRRITEYYKLTKNTITAFQNVDENGSPFLEVKSVKNFILAQFEKPSKALSIFSQVLEEFEKDEKFKKVLNQKLVSRLPK
jgi:hypothetical protein